MPCSARPSGGRAQRGLPGITDKRRLHPYTTATVFRLGDERTKELAQSRRGAEPRGKKRGKQKTGHCSSSPSLFSAALRVSAALREFFRLLIASWRRRGCAARRGRREYRL